MRRTTPVVRGDGKAVTVKGDLLKQSGTDARRNMICRRRMKKKPAGSRRLFSCVCFFV
jgi:hypothetical protein